MMQVFNKQYFCVVEMSCLLPHTSSDLSYGLLGPRPTVLQPPFRSKHPVTVNMEAGIVSHATRFLRVDH